MRSHPVILMLGSLLGICGLRSAWAEALEGKIPCRVIGMSARGDGERYAPVTTAISLQPGGRLLATGGDDHVVRIWDVETGRLVHTLSGHEDWIRDAEFSPDGSILATAGNDRRVLLWDAHTGQQLAALTRQKEAIASLVYRPDGR